MESTGNSKRIVSFLTDLPKADLHFHFEGAVPWQTIRKLHPRGHELPETPPWYKQQGFSSFSDFLVIFRDYVKPCLVNVSFYQEIASDIISWLGYQDVDYVEWNVSCKVMMENGIALHQGFSALDQVIKSKELSQKPNIKIIAGINREFSYQQKLDLLAEIDSISCISGIDIHGYESDNDLQDEAAFFDKAREHRWKIKVHAGELAGPHNIRMAIERFGIKHICHGIRAVEDPLLIDLITQKQVFLELCPSSNVLLKVQPDYSAYPLPMLLRSGVKLTLNTDDPMIFNCTLLKEYLLASRLGLSVSDLGVIALNSLEAAILPPRTKEILQRKVMDTVMHYEYSRQ